MGVMTAVDGLTVDDLDAMPDDGLRRELLDGMLLVTPAPQHRHQRALLRLALVMGAGCPDDLEVLFAPFDVRISPRTNLQPDLLVARRADISAADLPVAPSLAVEVLSPSTRLLDLNTKKAAYEQLGTTSYWVIDPGLDGAPSLTAWELDGSTYEQVAYVLGDETWTATLPFAVSITPSALVR